MKLLLIFPPGWSFVTGSPYLSTPLLKTICDKNKITCHQIDLNKGFANYRELNISLEEIKNNVNSFKSINNLYFNLEDKLNNQDKTFEGNWNLQLGFTYNKYSNQNSKHIQQAILEPTPFDSYYKKNIIPTINKTSPNVIAFSIVEQNQLIPSLRLIKLLRDNGFDGKILIGGNLITRLKNEIKQSQWLFDLIDFIIVFQGETPIVKLLQALKNNTSLEKVNSLIWKNKNVIIENRQLQKKEQDPNIISTPNFDGLDIQTYWGVNYLPLVHFRGCYFGRCSFCPIPYGWGFGGFAGASSVDKLFFEMNELYNKYGIFRFQLVDEAFTSNSAKKLSELIIKHNSPFEWMIYARFEKKWGDNGLAKQFYRGGLRKIHLGLEIISSSNRNALGKKDCETNVDGMLKILHESGIKVHLFCLFGFPGTTIKDADNTIQFIIDNKQMIDSVDINPFQLYKHTSVKNVDKIFNPNEDWAIYYDYIRKEDNLTNDDIESLTNEYEMLLWKEKHTLLHPIYRLYSPWLN